MFVCLSILHQNLMYPLAKITRSYLDDNKESRIKCLRAEYIVYYNIELYCNLILFNQIDYFINFATKMTKFELANALKLPLYPNGTEWHYSDSLQHLTSLFFMSGFELFWPGFRPRLPLTSGADDPAVTAAEKSSTWNKMFGLLR